MTKIYDQPHAYPPTHLKAEELFTIERQPGCKDSDEEIAAAREDFLKEANAYFAPFASPALDKDGHTCCFHCGERIDGFRAMIGLGVAYEWSLVHGEASCSGCHWPARGMHYPKDSKGEVLSNLRNLFLPYHPDYLREQSQLAP